MIRVLSFRPAVVVALLTLVGAPAAAQNIGKTTGNIRGVVKDDTGGVLPGVTVTATSPSLVGVRSVVTGADGAYDFPGLAIGPYKVQANLSGFAPSVVQGLELKAGQTLRADFVMKAGLTETVTVEGSSIIDVVSVEQQNNISAETFGALPKGRSWESIVEIAPSVNTEDINRTRGLSFQGASVHENVYIVDGVDATETTTASQGQDVVFEFLDNIQVKSGFLGAEYGGALGGVVNMQTKSGSNESGADSTSSTRGRSSREIRGRDCVRTASTSLIPKTKPGCSTSAAFWAGPSGKTSCGSSRESCRKTPTTREP